MNHRNNPRFTTFSLTSPEVHRPWTAHLYNASEQFCALVRLTAWQGTTGYVPRRLGTCLNNCYNNGVLIQDCTFRLQASILNRAGQEIAPLTARVLILCLTHFNLWSIVPPCLVDQIRNLARSWSAQCCNTSQMADQWRGRPRQVWCGNFRWKWWTRSC